MTRRRRCWRRCCAAKPRPVCWPQCCCTPIVKPASPTSRGRRSDPGNLHSEVERLVQAGILADRRVGRRGCCAPDSALTGPLANLLLLGYGPKLAVENAFRRHPGIKRAFIGGSWAARYQGQAGTFPHESTSSSSARPTATMSRTPSSRLCAQSATTDRSSSAPQQPGAMRRTRSPEQRRTTPS